MYPGLSLEADFWWKLGTAILCGAIVGTERQLRGKAAGLRTSILICLGTAVFVNLGVGLQSPFTDSTRVLGQVVSGIGFLGAGVILARGEIITGVTTAATIWVLAAIGACVGLGELTEAVVVSLTTVLILIVLRMLESMLPWMAPPSDDHPPGSPNTAPKDK